MTKKQFIEEILSLSEMIYRASFRILRDSEKARDMVQQIVCTLWDKRNSLHTVENKQAYIMRITKNACLDKLRTQKFTTQLKQYHQVTEPGYERQENIDLIKTEISKLPEKQRLIIELRDIEGFSFESISEMLDLSVNTIRVSLSLARKKVRFAIKKIYSYGT